MAADLTRIYTVQITMINKGLPRNMVAEETTEPTKQLICDEIKRILDADDVIMLDSQHVVHD